MIVVGCKTDVKYTPANDPFPGWLQRPRGAANQITFAMPPSIFRILRHTEDDSARSDHCKEAAIKQRLAVAHDDESLHSLNL